MKDVTQGKSQTILLIIVGILVGWNIFTTNGVKTDVNGYKEKIEGIQVKIDSTQLVNKQIDTKVVEVKNNITNITKEIHRIDNNLTIVKEKTNEKVNNANNFGNVQLEQLLTARYN
jgi:peptidoglycan hydrolase CwlO-like protein